MASKNNATGNAALEAATRLATGTPQPVLEQEVRKNNQEVEVKEKKRRALADRYKAEKKVTVIGAPMYQAYFGRQMPIILNGIAIYVPLNGDRFEIPESFACIFNERTASVNEEMELQRRRSDVTANYEKFPGELDLVRKV